MTREQERYIEAVRAGVGVNAAFHELSWDSKIDVHNICKQARSTADVVRLAYLEWQDYRPIT